MIKFLLLIYLVPAIQGSTIEGFEAIRSEHFDFANRDAPNSVQLTPGEMKMFAGHALRLVKHKCHAIDFQKLFEIQKYIAKRLSLLNPMKPGEKEDTYMVNVIESMKNCSKYLLTPNAKALKAQDGLVHVVLFKTESEQGPSSAASKKLPDEVVNDNDEETLEFSTDIPPPLPTPAVEEPHEGPMMVPIVQFSFSDWFSSIWRSVRTFFHDAFNPNHNTNHPRSRRSAPPLYAKYSDPEVETPAPKHDGKQAFATLFDEVCGIYCQCPNHATAEQFQVGVIQLLKFLFTDQKSLDTAAAHLIDDELIKEIKACAA